ncbi:hypothetical protein DFH11DRAFT_1543264 [Phellopilus nigrolimitatus]|nr:hypothetical protein DFH11DRAFT_1543264 [Phellopilus nigrolimitatus]
MEAYNSALFPQQWIHSTPDNHQHVQDNVPQQSPPPTVQNGAITHDDWSKAVAQPPIDLSEFGLGDLQGPSSSSSSIAPMQHLYHQFAPHMSQNGHPFFSTVAPFNMVSYGQAAAASAWPQQNLPLSSYSTLNGATSSVGSNQQQQQQSQSSNQSPVNGQSMVIDPALTLNGASSNPSPSFSPPPPTSSSQGTSQRSPSTTFINHFQQQQQQPQQPATVNPLYMQQQHMYQQQRTLNPQQLSMGYPQFMYHHPMPGPASNSSQTPVQTNLTASSSSQVNAPVPLPSPPAPSPAERRAAFVAKLSTLLSPSALSNASTVKSFVDAIKDYGTSSVPAKLRTQIASKIRDNAGNQFFRAWNDSEEAIVILKNWLKHGASDKDDGRWEETIMPLLHVVDRLPLTLEQLADNGIGKIVKSILKMRDGNPPPAIKDMASNIERKWRTMFPPDSPNKKAEIEDKTKKRKLSDVSSKAAPPAKKVSLTGASGPVASSSKVKKEKVVVTAVKDAKADSAFFSAPKPKPKLPSFKKAPPASAAGAGRTDVNIAQPNNIDPFQEALKSMAKARAPSAQLTPEPAPASAGAAVAAVAAEPGLTKSGKKRKVVTWAPEAQLCKVKLIEKAVYDDDPADGSQSAHSIRDLERAEGAALHRHLFEEAVDWSEPQAIEFPEDIEASIRPRGCDSLEKDAQEEREKSTLGSLYINAAQIPDSPAEPVNQIAADAVDASVRTMIVGAEIQPFFQQAMSVSDLVGQLRSSAEAGGVGNIMGTGVSEYPGVNGNGVAIVNGATNDALMGETSASAAMNAYASNIDLRTLGLDPNALSSLAAQLAQFGGALPGFGANSTDPAAAYAQQQAAGVWGAYGQQQTQPQQPYSEYGYDEREREEREGRGRGLDHRDRGDRAGFRGRGRGGGRGGRGGPGGSGNGGERVGGGGSGSDFKSANLEIRVTLRMKVRRASSPGSLDSYTHETTQLVVTPARFSLYARTNQQWRITDTS